MPENPIKNASIDMLLESIGKKLFEIRKARREKETSVARSIGISHAVISRIENAKYKRITLELLLKLTQYYSISIDELISLNYSNGDTVGGNEGLVEYLLKENKELKKRLNNK